MMKELLEQEMKRIRLEKKDMLLKAAAIVIFVSLAAMWLLDYIPRIDGVVGYAVYDTTLQEYDVSGTAGRLAFDQTPDFKMSAGDRFRYEIEGISGKGMFYDDTRLFNITPEGVIEFVPREDAIGRHNVWIIYKNDQEYHYQNVVFEIEE